MNKAFQLCVNLLVYLAAKCNVTYEAINVWIFIVIGPVIFVGFLWIIYHQQVIISTLRQAK